MKYGEWIRNAYLVGGKFLPPVLTGYFIGTEQYFWAGVLGLLALLQAIERKR